MMKRIVLVAAASLSYVFSASAQQHSIDAHGMHRSFSELNMRKVRTAIMAYWVTVRDEETGELAATQRFTDMVVALAHEIDWQKQRVPRGIEGLKRS